MEASEGGDADEPLFCPIPFADGRASSDSDDTGLVPVETAASADASVAGATSTVTAARIALAGDAVTVRGAVGVAAGAVFAVVPDCEAESFEE